MVEIKKAIKCKDCLSDKLVKSGSTFRKINGNRERYSQWQCKNCGLISAKVMDENGELKLIPYEKKEC